MLCVLILSCKESNDEVEQAEVREIKATVLSVIEMPNEVEQGKEFEITLNLLINICYSFSRIEQRLEGKDIFIDVYSKEETIDPSVECPTSLYEKEITKSITLDYPSGDYRLKFTGVSQQSIVKEILIQ